MNIMQRSTTFRVGDIIRVNFPEAERPDEPGEKRRPCVVLGHCPELNTVTVAYGSGMENKSNLGVHIEVTKPNEMIEAGLKKPTRFSIHRISVVPINRRYINAEVIGRMPTQRFDEFADCVARVGFPMTDPAMQLAPVFFLLRGSVAASSAKGIVMALVTDESETIDLPGTESISVTFLTDGFDLNAITDEMVKASDFLTSTEKVKVLKNLHL